MDNRCLLTTVRISLIASLLLIRCALWIEFVRAAEPASPVADRQKERPISALFSGRVVSGEQQKAAGAQVFGFGTESIAYILQADANDEGKFECRRELVPMVLWAGSRDRRLGGIARIDAKDTKGEISLVPTVAAHGRLIDDEFYVPANNYEIQFGVQITFPDQSSSMLGGGHANTNADGEFTAQGLIPGQKYVFLAVVGKDSKGFPNHYGNPMTVTPKPGETAELGALHLPKANRPAPEVTNH